MRFKILDKLIFRRHRKICTRQPIVPMWYFRKHIRAGVNIQLRNFVENKTNKVVATPYIAAGSTLLIWRKHRLNFEISAMPYIYSTKINSIKVRRYDNKY